MSLTRPSAVLACLAALAALAGCGGGKGGGTGTTVSAPPPTNASTDQTTQTVHSPPPPPTNSTPTRTSTSPAQQGGNRPIATQALFTGRGGKVTPARVRVPPFIAVRAVLVSADRKGYTLVVAGKELAVGEGLTRAAVTLSGLRPGGRYVLANQFGNAPRRLVIVANAEPGP